MRLIVEIVLNHIGNEGDGSILDKEFTFQKEHFNTCNQEIKQVDFLFNDEFTVNC